MQRYSAASDQVFDVEAPAHDPSEPLAIGSLALYLLNVVSETWQKEKWNMYK